MPVAVFAPECRRIVELQLPLDAPPAYDPE